MNYLNDLQTKIKEFDELRKQFNTKLAEMLKDSLKEFFSENPVVKCIVWDQYTPYFNDGDPCCFGIGEIHFAKKNYEGGRSYDYEEHSVSFYRSEDDPVLVERCRALDTVLHSMKDQLEDMFGDHATVIVTPTTITVEECEHD